MGVMYETEDTRLGISLNLRFLVALLTMLTCGVTLLQASDHSDAPILRNFVRSDAGITDLYAFVAGSSLVLAVSTNPDIPKSAAAYVFPSDVTFEINIDIDARVSTCDPMGDGGTVIEPGAIKEDIRFRISFRDDGSPKIQRFVRGGANTELLIVNFFVGLRDDPFIRIPRDGRNIGAIVLEVPLASVVRSQSTLLIWATAKVQGFKGPQQEIAGRSLRSMFIEQNALNSLHPKHHLSRTGLRPDVMIYDTAQPAVYPNGRGLTDDVVLLACQLGAECRVLTLEGRNSSGPSRTNDLPFLSSFPYLAPPHPPAP